MKRVPEETSGRPGRLSAFFWKISQPFGQPSFVFAAALVVRLALWASVGPTQPFIGDDQGDYLAIRAGLVEHGALLDPVTGKPTAYRDPAYPVFLAAILRAGSAAPHAIVVVQILLSALTGALLVVVTGRAAGRKAAGITGLLFTLQTGFATYGLFVYPEVLFCFIATFLFLLLEAWTRDKRPSTALLAGLVAGAALLTRFAAGLAIFLLLAVTIWKGRPARISQYIWMIVLPILTVGLWSWRNFDKVGVFAPNTSGAVNLYLGNSEAAEHERRGDRELQSAVWQPIEGLSESARVRRSIELAGIFWRTQPGKAAYHTLLKLPNALEFDRVFIAVSRRGEFPSRSPAWLLVVGGLVVLASLLPYSLSLASVFRPRGWIEWASVTFAAGILVAQIATVAHSRYSMPAWVFLLPGAGAFWARFRGNQARDWIPPGLAILVLGIAWVREILLS